MEVGRPAGHPWRHDHVSSNMGHVFADVRSDDIMVTVHVSGDFRGAVWPISITFDSTRFERRRTRRAGVLAQPPPGASRRMTQETWRTSSKTAVNIRVVTSETTITSTETDVLDRYCHMASHMSHRMYCQLSRKPLRHLLTSTIYITPLSDGVPYVECDVFMYVRRHSVSY
jgi:hypothetical protein